MKKLQQQQQHEGKNCERKRIYHINNVQTQNFATSFDKSIPSLSHAVCRFSDSVVCISTHMAATIDTIFVMIHIYLIC